MFSVNAHGGGFPLFVIDISWIAAKYRNGCTFWGINVQRITPWLVTKYCVDFCCFCWMRWAPSALLWIVCNILIKNVYDTWTLPLWLFTRGKSVSILCTNILYHQSTTAKQNTFCNVTLLHAISKQQDNTVICPPELRSTKKRQNGINNIKLSCQSITCAIRSK